MDFAEQWNIFFKRYSDHFTSETEKMRQQGRCLFKVLYANIIPLLG